MGRVVGGKGRMGMIKNLPQFNHCQQLFSSSSSSLTNSVPCTHTVTPEKERESDLLLQRKSARDKKEKHTERWEEMFHDKVRAGAVIFRDGEQASVQKKKWECASKRGRERERAREENGVAVAQGCVFVFSSSLPTAPRLDPF